jgi:hypothetical protein
VVVKLNKNIAHAKENALSGVNRYLLFFLVKVRPNNKTCLLKVKN